LKLLIDGDMIVHRSTVAVEKDTRFLDRYHILFSDAEAAWNVVVETMGELQEAAGTADVVVTFSDPERNFRKSLVGDDYKSNRAGSRKPLAYWETRKRCEETWDTLMYPELEADDTMGILMTRHPGEYILWSLDKDLKQIPGKHLVDDEVITRDLASCDRFFYQQVLSGDTTDGYTGCPGIGAERAAQFLAQGVEVYEVEHILKSGPRKGQKTTKWEDRPAASPWDTVMSLYTRAGLTEDDALLNARMAKILRNEDYVNGKVVLWTPPT
jgi:5'-3' exonuclease